MDRHTRQSLFIRLSELHNARVRGWSEYTNSAGERSYLFHPALFSAYVRLHMSEHHASTVALQDLVTASGLIGAPATAEERLRRVSSALARRAAFATDVLDAYSRLCAMCGLNLGLIEAAHIYPAHAPDSPDSVTNGIALCRNHHAAFDQHWVWISPKTFEIKVHPEWTAAARQNRTSRAFIGSFLPILRTPTRPNEAPSPKFFRQRYDHYGDSYLWARR